MVEQYHEDVSLA